METNMLQPRSDLDLKAPVPVLNTTPPVGGNFLSCQPRGDVFDAPISGKLARASLWNQTGRPDGCRQCNSRWFRPKVFGLCTDCFADRIAVIQHEERLVA